MADSTTMPSIGFSRWQASGIHLLISAAIAAVALLVVLKVWYPTPLFTAEGGSELLMILVAVDVVIGPLITLVIFKAGKPGLRFDLTVIAIIQACALLYGVYVMFVARPVYIAFVVDQFETVRANDLDATDVAQAVHADFRSLPLTGPVYVAIEMPTDIKALKGLIAEAQKGGKVVQHLPRYYIPYSRHKEQVISNSQSAEAMQKRGGELANVLEKFLTESGRKAADLKLVPLQTRRGVGVALIDARNGEIVTLLPPKL